MSKMVMGIGSSHSPVLLMEPPAWLRRGEVSDPQNALLFDQEGKHVQYGELLERSPPALLKELDPQRLAERYEANNNAIARIAEVLLDVDPDIVVVVGDDHKEVYQDDNMPALAVYWGETLPYRPIRLMKWPYEDDLKTELWYPQDDRDYPVAAAFARRLIGDLCEREFDPAHSQYYPEGQGMTHSFGYIYHRIMTKKVWPVIPVSINTYYPPNQITPRRAFKLGRAIRSAIESWPEDLRVVTIATGGLSHFVVDEPFDQAFLEILKSGSIEDHAKLPREKLQSGNSELRCWSVLAGTVEGLSMNLIDYVPCYRSKAGTGCGMAFAYWE
ncbi:MAG TPA: hypothetical protein VN805_08205 [Caulobacteraceae bacterium]|nr:hypothetical protein [Caulobacteraceae bacterium]